MQKDEYRRRRHSKTLLYAHLIFVTKFREKLSEKWIWERVKYEIYKRCIAMGISVLRVESDTDHIHLLLEYPPTNSMSTIAHDLKQVTTYSLWKHYPTYMKKHFWSRRVLQSEGYFACSVGNASKETIDAYIRQQG